MADQTARTRSADVEHGTILCATRGGKASLPAQDAAIRLAQEQGRQIVFVYVADVEFVDMVSSAVLVDVEEQMGELGDFLLLMARERAEQAGVRAYAEVRTGRFREALIDVAERYHATTVVLGRPRDQDSLTQQEYLDRLGQQLREILGVDVLLV